LCKAGVSTDVLCVLRMDAICPLPPIPPRQTRELVEILRLLDDSAITQEFTSPMSIRTLVERIDIKPSDREWLASVYTREQADSPLEPELTAALTKRRMSAASVRRQSLTLPRVASPPTSPLGPAAVGLGPTHRRRPSSSSVASTDVSEAPQDDPEGDGLVLLDTEGRSQGPFSVRQVLAWHQVGILGGQVRGAWRGGGCVGGSTLKSCGPLSPS
jgi:hypothetical protein